MSLIENESVNNFFLARGGNKSCFGRSIVYNPQLLSLQLH